jgi:hypothetical protein
MRVVPSFFLTNITGAEYADRLFLMILASRNLFTSASIISCSPLDLLYSGTNTGFGSVKFIFSLPALDLPSSFKFVAVT